MDDYSTLYNRAVKITEELDKMYSAYDFYWDVDADTLEIKIVAKSPYHYFNFKYPINKSNESIIRKIQSTLNSVSVTYVFGVDLNHENDAKGEN